jgi:hypothetical protein
MGIWLDRTCGDLEVVIEKLNENVPMQGACEKKFTKNKRLDRFRRAQNVIHDIFNNGLMNRGRELKMFGITTMELGIANHGTDWDRIENMLAPIFREIVMDAVLEQFGRQGYLDVCHNRSSSIVSKAVSEGRV